MSDGCEGAYRGHSEPGRSRGAFPGKTATAVARDGIEQHYTFFEIPLNGVRLDPRLDQSYACGV
jgi:hypothetical protein